MSKQIKISILFSLLLFVFTNKTFAQSYVDSTKWQVKGTILNSNFLSMPNLTLEAEYFIDQINGLSTEFGLGLIAYSFDKNDAALGFKVNQKINFLYHRNSKISQGVAININYASYKVNTYLLTEESGTNSTYFKFKKLDLYKKRYGGNIEYQLRTNQKIFMEFNVGLGIMYYSAEPKSIQVVQDAYRNGLFYINHTPMLNPILRLKVGYKLGAK